MGRIILVLIAASLLATLLIIRNSSFQTTTRASQAAEDASKKAEKARAVKPEQPSRAKTVKKGATKTSRPYTANNPTEASVSTAGSKEEERSLDQDGNAFVKSEGTPVYSVNSRQSNIMRLLKRGDRVGTDLEVLDEKGKWTIVRKADLSRPGFVLDENLQKANPGKKSGEQ